MSKCITLGSVVKICCFVAAVAFSASANAQYQNTPFDPGTWNPSGWFPQDQGGYTDGWEIESGAPNVRDYKFVFRNRTHYNVAFRTTGRGWTQLAPGKGLTVNYRGGPAIVEISQIGGTGRTFTLPSSGRYAFRVRHGIIVNAFDD